MVLFFFYCLPFTKYLIIHNQTYILFEKTNYNVNRSHYQEEIKIEITSLKSDINTLDSLKSELKTVRYKLKKYQALYEDIIVSKEKAKPLEQQD